MVFRRRIPDLRWILTLITFLILSIGVNPAWCWAEGRIGGISIEDLNPALIQLAELRPPFYGVVVMDVDPYSPAALSGIRPGDVIQWVNSTSVQNVSQLRDTIWRTGLDPVTFQVNRQGTAFVFTVSLR